MTYGFNRALLLCPTRYSLANIFAEILGEMAEEVRTLDIQKKISALILRFNSQAFRLPFRARSAWEKWLLRKANSILLREIQVYRPDIVLVYNSEFLIPEACAEIRKGSRLVFFMGDNPFYTPLNNYYLACLAYADLILSPDTFWIEQLKTIGLKKIKYFIPGIDERSYYCIDKREELQRVDETDVLYVGGGYVNSWGYKKALLMSQFTGFKFRLYGNKTWKRWIKIFPELKNNYRESEYIPTAILNRMYNKTKLVPVDGNPGILNGFHMRLFETLGAGALPLVEYRKDVDELLFNGSKAMVPLIRDYHRVKDIAAHFLKNEDERVEIVNGLKSYISERYNVKNATRILLDNLKPFT